MVVLGLMLLLVAADPDDGLAKKMLPIYVKEAAAYSMVVESAPKQALELKKEPVFEWSNPVRAGGQLGVVFLWLRDGRPALLGCIFSIPNDRFSGRWISHEFHALDPEKLLVSHPGGYNAWKPQAGLTRTELPDAGAPAGDRGARLLQMRRLAQEFTGHSVDKAGKRWELRLLPAPLYRYPAASTGVVDGALFTLVSNAGTDPEVLLLLEAKEAGGKLRWEYACGRFSDWELRLQRKAKALLSSLPSEPNPFAHDPLHLYRIYPDKIVSLEGKLLARIRQNPNGPGGEAIPVNEK